MKLFLYFVSIFCLAQSPPLIRWAEAPLELIGFWRLLASALCLYPFLLYYGENPVRQVRSGKLNGFVLLSALFFFGHLATYFYAVQTTRIANCMILFSTHPLWVALGNRIFFGQKLTARILVSYVFAAAGILILMGHSVGTGGHLLLGDMASLLTAFLFAGYILTGKRARQDTSNWTYSFFMYLIAGLLFGGMCLTTSVSFTGWPLHTWLAIAGAVVVPTLMGHALFMWLMKYMDVNAMTCGKLLEPVAAAFVASWFFAEDLPARTAIAFAFTAAGVVILFWPALRPKGLGTSGIG